MKVTRVIKAGSVPDMTVDHSSDPGGGGKGFPATMEDAPPPDERHHYWPASSSNSSSLRSNDASRDLVPVSSSTPVTPTRMDVTPRLDMTPLRFAEPMAKRGRLFASRLHKRRLVLKNGECNVKSRNVTKRKRKYIVDIFTTLVDMKWRYHLLLFALAFVLTWITFGAIWYGIAISRMDDVYMGNDSWKPCVDNVHDYNSALLFSIETQTTIGYGYRVIQPHCSIGIFVMMIQSCLGLFIQAVITGIVFSKISRPKGRAQTIMFSEKAAICKRDGEYCLTFRVGDMRKSHIISTSIRALLVRNRLTAEGESIPLCQYPLSVETEMSKSDSFVFLIWPVTVVHRIDSTSPLWEVSPDKLLTEHFEVIVILEGTVESTGMSTQVRTSYIPTEIMWGQRLVPLLTFQLKDGHYEIDYKQFHNTTPTTMPDCSAKEYAETIAHLAPGELPPDASDYPVSFTAPAIRLKGIPHGGPLHSLFPRNIEAIRRKRTITKDAGKTKAESGSRVNKAFQKHPACLLVHELHHGNNHLQTNVAVSASPAGPGTTEVARNKMRRLQSLEERPVTGGEVKRISKRFQVVSADETEDTTL